MAVIKDIRLLLFDLDGTLVDSALDIAASANHVLLSHGLPTIPEPDIKKYIGGGLRQLISGLAPHKVGDAEFLKAAGTLFHEHYSRNLLRRTRFYPGAQEFLAQWRHPTAVVTNKIEFHAREILKGLGADEARFFDIVGGDRLPTKKPDPDQILHILEKTGIAPSQTLLVGDSPQDVLAAKAAGVHCVCVTFGYNSVEKLREAGAEHFISHFGELASLVRAAV